MRVRIQETARFIKDETDNKEKSSTKISDEMQKENSVRAIKSEKECERGDDERKKAQCFCKSIFQELLIVDYIHHPRNLKNYKKKKIHFNKFFANFSLERKFSMMPSKRVVSRASWPHFYN